MGIDDEKRTRFTVGDLPEKPAFEKEGIKQPVLGKKIVQVGPRPAPPGMSSSHAPKRFAVDPVQGFSPYQFAVQVPAFKDVKVKPELGLKGESTRAFKPLVSKTLTKGLTRKI